MTKTEFEDLIGRLGNAWNAGDATSAAGCFAATVDYADPLRYRFSTPEELLPFFAPGPNGHEVSWHRVLFDESASTGAVEYTYRGHHRYHGVAIVEVDDGGLISAWREWQHRSDDRAWEAFLAADR